MLLKLRARCSTPLWVLLCCTNVCARYPVPVASLVVCGMPLYHSKETLDQKPMRLCTGLAPRHCKSAWLILAGAQVRPPVAHRFGCGPLAEGEAPPGVQVFRHRLLQHFMLSLFCKLPVQPMTRIVDMRAAFMVRGPPLVQDLCVRLSWTSASVMLCQCSQA